MYCRFCRLVGMLLIIGGIDDSFFAGSSNLGLRCGCRPALVRTRPHNGEGRGAGWRSPPTSKTGTCYLFHSLAGARWYRVRQRLKLIPIPRHLLAADCTYLVEYVRARSVVGLLLSCLPMGGGGTVVQQESKARHATGGNKISVCLTDCQTERVSHLFYRMQKPLFEYLLCNMIQILRRIIVFVIDSLIFLKLNVFSHSR